MALTEESKFEKLSPSRKRFLDTVNMIVCRAETAMVGIVRESLSRADDVRSLVQDLFRLEADLLPDAEKQQLGVRVHPLSNPRAIGDLLQQLNAASMICPSTNLTLTCSLLAPQN